MRKILQNLKEIKFLFNKKKILLKKKKMEGSNEEILNIIHFNDVYDIEPDNNKGGCARFYTALQKYNDPKPLIFFSGDVFSPSHRLLPF